MGVNLYQNGLNIEQPAWLIPTSCCLSLNLNQYYSAIEGEECYSVEVIASIKAKFRQQKIAFELCITNILTPGIKFEQKPQIIDYFNVD